MGECHLDDLLDILDEDDIEERNEEAKAHQESQTVQKSEVSPPKTDPEQEKLDPEKEALKRKLQQMEEQMALIKSQLGSKKETGGSVQEVDMFASNSNVDDRRLRSPVKVSNTSWSFMVHAWYYNQYYLSLFRPIH